MIAGGVTLLMVAVALAALARLASIARLSDPNVGLTTSFALVAVVLIGALATKAAMLAAGVAVLIASLLAARDLLRDVSTSVLTAQ